MKKAGTLVVIIVSMLMIIVTVPLFADQTVITDDGKKILLKENKAWEYVIVPESTLEISSGFRKAAWGMSMEQVSTLETSKRLSQNNEMVSYAGVLNDLDCLILYIFVRGKLVRGKYIITERHSNGNDYISDYNNLKQMLTRKYGPPSSDKQYWKNDLYKSDQEEWGSAVSSGDLALNSQWQTPATDITLKLSGGNYAICLVLEYQSVELKNLEYKIIEKLNLEELQSYKWIE